MYKRIHILLIIFLAIFLALILRVGYISIFKHVEYSQLSVNQRVKALVYDCNRGDILDRNLEPLLTKESSLGWYRYCDEKNDIVFQQSECEGSIPVKFNERKSDIAHHVIGLTNHHKLYNIYGYQGVSGLEYQYNDKLRAAPSRIIAITDVYGKLTSSEHFYDINNSTNDTSVVVTLDKNLQKVVEDTLTHTLEQGAIIIMDPNTGEILSMASRPIYNFNQVDDGSHINKAITTHKQTSPASLFKLVITIVALEEGYQKEDKFQCSGDNCLVNHGSLTLEEALAHSCNEVFHKIVYDVGADTILQRASDLGLGNPTNVGLLQESSGRLPDIETVSGCQGSKLLALGQGQLETTPIQIAKLTSVIANGGYQVQPNIIHYVGPRPTSPMSIDPFNQRLISNGVAKDIQKMMNSTILYGTARQLSYGGGVKTGTSDNGNRWISGFFPYNRPKYVITIIVEEGDNPVGILEEILSKIDYDKR
ncbi:penicillin-binding transpeptidase domain-containing protein [Proteinivorax tanatarense]|uniref:beta-lactamase n=1 Tax=Proteinivorax tanatarense TaxID=1260629 RepID=A0AAU7VNY6_9FIRM